MLSDQLRRWSRPLLEVMASGLARVGLSPDAVTLIGLGLNVAVGAVLAMGHLRVGGLLVLVASLADSLDGALARHVNKVSPFGAFFDSTVDRYSETALFAGLLWYFAGAGARQESMLVLVVLAGSLLVSYTRARAEGLGIACTVGLFSRAERMVVLAIGLAIGQPLATLWVLAIFGHFTAVQRILHVRRQIAA